MPYDLKAVNRRMVVIRTVFSRPDEPGYAFAKRMGATATAWSAWETTQRPGLDASIRLVEALGLSLDWIYLGDYSTLRFNVAEELRNAESSITLPEPVARSRDGQSSRAKKPSSISLAKSKTRRA